MPTAHQAPRRPKLLVALACALLLTACTATAPREASAPRGRLTQVSTINALLVGRYDGLVTLRELLRAGDFGLGTFHALDGEMIVLDGRVYQATADGAVREPSLDEKTPFAAVVPFRADERRSCPPAADLTELEAWLDATMPAGDRFAAVRLEGEFSSISFRSVPRQQRPYPPLVEAAKGQSVWTLENASGTLVGLRCPRWAAGLNVPGYHWHFLTRDKSRGGHVLAAALLRGTAEVSRGDQWLILPDPEAGAAGGPERDLHRELEEVERPRVESGR